MSGDSPAPARLWALTSPRHVHTVKQALDRHGLLDRSVKIVSGPERVQRDFALPDALLGSGDDAAVLCAVPTALTTESGFADSLSGEDKQELSKVLSYAVRHAEAGKAAPTARATAQGDRLEVAVRQWLRNLPEDARDKLPEHVRREWPCPSYRKHGKLLVLAADVFDHGPWRLLPAALVEYADQLYEGVCARLDVTHIVVTAPIPRATGAEGEIENVLRAPAALRPLYGDFPALEGPSAAAFERALWVNTKQNGVHQVFATMYTMFSNGNVNEKRRVMSDEMFVRAAREQPCSAADLYAGIGYFAFSYAKAGYEKVLCWEISKWSVEGLCRGSRLNGWTSTVFEGNEACGPTEVDGAPLDSKFLVFNESNEHALARVNALRAKLPPIVHVNCGYLPSSRPSWATAVRILDESVGGWVHAHENCAKEDIPQRRIEIQELFRAEANAAFGSASQHLVECEHVERVKSYAPGVIHCVFDIHISSSWPG